MACKKIYKWDPEWINANYGITLNESVINVFDTWENMVKDYDMLKARYPHLKFSMHVKTRGVQ